mgnify:FL=1
MRRNGGSGGANGCRSDLRDVSEERLLPVGKQLPLSTRCRHRGPARGIQRDSWYAVMICAYALVGLMETTVRPIEDTPWVPVTHDSAPINKPEENDILPDAFRKKLLPLQVDLPPSLLPVHASIFNSIPPAEWG